MRAERPFHTDAWVVLPEHIHCVITLPPGDTDFSHRIKSMKTRFVGTIRRTKERSTVRAKRGERGIWQRRFWDHVIRDDRDYARHVDYAHYNPVKHGYVKRARDWPYSTFHRWLAEGLYHPDWAEQGVEDLEAGERGDPRGRRK
jgi:putative transposase